MKCLDNKNYKEITLLIESYNDLWTLLEILEPGDIIESEADRKVKIGTEENYKVVRKKFSVTITIQKTDVESERLAITGEIQNENEYLARGSTQTIRPGIGEKIKITKEFLSFQKKILDRALESYESKNLLVLVDNDTLIISEFTDRAHSIIFEKKGLGNKKRYKDESRDDIEVKLELIKDYLQRDYNNFIIAGPGFWKNQLEERIKEEFNKKVIVFQWNEVSDTTVPKVINSMTRKGLLRENSLVEEIKFIEELKLRMAKESLYTYSEPEVKKAINYGAVETLMISSSFIEKAKEKGSYQELRELFRTVESSGAGIMVINSRNEPGATLDGLSGIAALLRFKI